MDVPKFDAPATVARSAEEVHVSALSFNHGLKEVRTTSRALAQGSGEQMIFAGCPQWMGRLRIRHLASFPLVDPTASSRHPNRGTSPHWRWSEAIPALLVAGLVAFVALIRWANQAG